MTASGRRWLHNPDSTMRKSTLALLGMGLVAGLLLVLALISPPQAARAQGSGEGPYHIEAGPFQLEVLAIPSNLSLGTVQYMIRVLDARNQEPVTDARVRINGRHASSDQVGWARALNTPQAPGEYSARIELDGPGVWEMSVDVSSDLGRVEVGVPSQTVPEPRQSGAGTLVFLGVFAVLILGGGYLVWSIRRAQRKREAHNAG